jgi:hydrogenase large subunit
MTTITIDPVTRLEGHLKIEVQIETVKGVQQVIDAWAAGTLFRGFESILVNRPPEDAQHITQRICGVCPVSHGMAAVKALDTAFKASVPTNARIMRNLVLGANYIQSHILHFYHLSVPDFIDGPAMPPWQPSWSFEKRITSGASTLVDHYKMALEKRTKAHEMGALFGGRLPHPPTFLPGGITTTPRQERIDRFKSLLNELISFIKDIYIKDVQFLANAYNDYFSLGKGPGNLLAYGVFDQDSSGTSKLLRSGYLANGSQNLQSLNVNGITEQVTYSWYDDATNNLNPSVGKTVPMYPKPKGNASNPYDPYSWLKAPRYQGQAAQAAEAPRRGRPRPPRPPSPPSQPGQPCEVGPLARMKVNGDYTGGISVMDRHLARAQEALKVANAMMTWVGQLKVGQPVYSSSSVPLSATSYGLTEAPRGALGHWLQIANGTIGRYMVVTPTCWNASPRDSSGKRGPLEEALIGTPVNNINEPIEVLRVVHSFDPCLSCAVHVVRPGKGSKIFALGHYHGEGETQMVPVHKETCSHGC